MITRRNKSDKSSFKLTGQNDNFRSFWLVAAKGDLNAEVAGYAERKDQYRNHETTGKAFLSLRSPRSLRLSHEMGSGKNYASRS